MIRYFLLFLAARLLLGLLLIRNFDHPDETWQGPEIAHKIVFGYGFETWEWKTDAPIRSHLYPLILSAFYRLFQLLGLGDTDWIVKAPLFYQSIVGSVFDYFLLKLNQLYNPGTNLILIFLLYTNWFGLSILSRTHINGTQAMLIVVGFYLWNIRKKVWWADGVSRLLAIINFVLRGTSVLFWAVVWPYELFTMKGSLLDRLKFIVKNALTVAGMVGCSLLFAYWWYGSWQSIEYNFYYFNIKLKWSDLYGKFPLFSYFYIFFPYIFGGHAVYYLKGIRDIMGSNQAETSSKKDDQMDVKKKANEAISSSDGYSLKEVLLLTLLIVLVLSTSSHKQPRFLLPIFPLLMLVAVKGYRHASKAAVAFSLIFNFTLFFVNNCYGREGGYQVLDFIRHEKSVTGVLFLTECHLTPIYSVLHRNVPVRFPDCSPINRLTGNDENTRLWRDPDVLYKEMLVDLSTEPSHMIVQRRFEKKFNIDSSKYEKVAEYTHSSLFEQLFMGYDSLAVYRKRHK